MTSKGQDLNVCSATHLLCHPGQLCVASPWLTFAEWLLLCPPYVLTALHTRVHLHNIFIITNISR